MVLKKPLTEQQLMEWRRRVHEAYLKANEALRIANLKENLLDKYVVEHYATNRSISDTAD